MSVKIKSFLRKWGSSAVLLGFGFFVPWIATMGCCWTLYQPKEPENMKKFSKIK